MESISTPSGFEVFATSENLKVYGKRENYLKIHNYLTWLSISPFDAFQIKMTAVVSGVEEEIGTVVLQVRRDNHLNNGGIYDNFVIFDFRDIVNSIAPYNATLKFKFSGGKTATLQIINTTIGSMLIDVPPIRQIPFKNGNFDFFFAQTFWKYFVGWNNDIVELSEQANLTELMRTYGLGFICENPPTGAHYYVFTRQFTRQFGVKRDAVPRTLKLVPLECEKDYELIQWIGANGLKKSWWFEVTDRQVYTTETLQLFDIEKNNKYLKDSNLRCTLKCEYADYATRCYIADIVQSDEVEAVNTSGSADWNTSILVETQALSVGEPNTYNDVILTANFENYGRI